MVKKTQPPMAKGNPGSMATKCGSHNKSPKYPGTPLQTRQWEESTSKMGEQELPFSSLKELACESNASEIADQQQITKENTQKKI